MFEAMKNRSQEWLAYTQSHWGSWFWDGSCCCWVCCCYCCGTRHWSFTLRCGVGRRRCRFCHGVWRSWRRCPRGFGCVLGGIHCYQLGWGIRPRPVIYAVLWAWILSCHGSPPKLLPTQRNDVLVVEFALRTTSRVHFCVSTLLFGL